MNYQIKIKGLTIILPMMLLIIFSCTKTQVSKSELISKFSVTTKMDLKTEKPDFIFLTEAFGKLTELEFFGSGLLKGIVEGDPFGTGGNYGYSFDSIKWKLDRNEITIIIPRGNQKGEKNETIKKLNISKENNSIVLKTKNVVYILKKK